MNIIPAKKFREMSMREVLQSVEIAMEVLKDRKNELTIKDFEYILAIIEDFSKILYAYISQ
jgi:hypothetical protein